MGMCFFLLIVSFRLKGVVFPFVLSFFISGLFFCQMLSLVFYLMLSQEVGKVDHLYMVL